MLGLSPRKLLLLPLLLPILLLLPSAGPDPAPAAPEDARVVLLGFDGADGRTVEELVAARPGEYPNFERLMRDGTFARLGTVAPPESPVSWAALNTGQNPAKTGVPGFVKRINSSRPLPAMGHLTSEKKKLEEFDNTPIPAWSAGKLAGVAGAGVFVIFLLIFAVLLRLKLALAGVLSLMLGGIGGWCGYTVRGLLAEEYPRYSNPNQARNFWDYLADEDVGSLVLDAAQAFDMPGGGARVLAGLGVPDARGGIGDWCIYTTSDDVFKEPPAGEGTGTAGKMFKVYERDGKIASRVYGPANFWAEERMQKKLDRLKEKLNDPSLDYSSSLDLLERQRETEEQLAELKREGTSVPLEVELAGDTATIKLGEESQEVGVGEWSDYYHLAFELNWLLKVHAITRVKLVQTEPHFELYVNVLDIDPEKPPFWQSLSTPFAFSAELAKAHGPYETYGWPTATMPFKDDVVAPELLMEDVEFTMKWRETLTYGSLQRDDWKVLMSVFSTTDRVQHMMYQYYDEGHPMYDEAEASKTFEFFGETITRKDAIPAIYRHMDRILGTVIDDHLGPNDTLLVCSDHGFQSFRRQVHINNWLAQAGYLKLKSPLVKDQNDDQLAFVDWTQTQAYCVGLGFIYLNLKGREAQGIVDPADADALIARIKADLLAAEDEETGAKICNEVYVVSEIHQGPYLDMESDMICGFAPTYRVSWGTTLGGLALEDDGNGGFRPAPYCVDNDKNWSGGHVSVALPDVAGVFFSNKKVDLPADGVSALHIAPTTLSLMGLGVPAEMDLPALSVQ
ncbi:MAG: alkaline phosphatase family protein [Planctomycetota bacterium]